MRQLETSKLGTVKTLNRRVRHLMLAATVAGLGGKSTIAASTWTGPGGSVATPTTGTWNTNTNWSPQTVPTSSSSTELDFLGTSSYISTDNISGAFNLNILKINGSGGAINASSGSSLAFAGTAPVINQIGAGIFNISSPVAFTAATSVNQVNSGEIDFNGALSGSALTLNNVSGSPTSSVVKFTGSNSFNGLTINSHVIAQSGLSSNSTTLGSGIVTLAGGILQLQGRQTAAGQASEQSIGVTGFSGDTIMDAASTSASTSSDGTPINAIDGGNALFVNGYVDPNGYANGATATDGKGLPASGIITSPLSSGAVFKLGYNGTSIDLADKNVLYFQSQTAQTLILAGSGVKATTLQFLAQSQNASSFDVQLKFSDGSTDTYAAAVKTNNWASFSGGNIYSNTAYTAPDALNVGNKVNPNFYVQLAESDLTLSAADALKTITSIQFTPDSPAGSPSGFGYSAEIYAVSGLVAGTSAVQLSSQTYANAVNVTANSSIDVSGSLAATMGAVSIGSNTLSVTSSDGTDTAYSLTLGATTLSGNASFDVANSTSGGAGTLNLGALNDGGTARTITFNPTNAGTVTLSSNATSLVTGTVINISNGTLNSNNSSSIGTSSTVNVSAPAIFSVGASQQISALKGTAGSVALGGNVLTIGSTDNLSSNFGGIISGTGYLNVTTTGTVTLSGASTFSGSTVNSNGAQITTSVLINNNANVVVAGASNVTNGTFVSGPLGTGTILANAGASLLLANSPGLTFPNQVYGTSTGSTPTTLGGLNTTGVTTFSGNIILGTGSSGDNSHSLIVGATSGGEVDFTGNILANSTTNASSVTVKNFTGSGTAVVRFTGGNTYNGGTTINPNATLAIGPAISNTGLGTGTVTLAGGTLALQGLLPSGVQQVVPLSGFNADTVLDKAASSGSASSTGTPTSTIDGGSLYFEDGYMGNASTGVPTGGAISSATTGHQFQLATDGSGLLTVNNTLQFTTANSPSSLALVTPASYKTLDFLVTGQSGSASNSVSVTLTFANGSSATIGGFSSKDWYGGSPGNNAVTGLDPLQQATGNILDYGGAMTLQEYDLTLPTADQGLAIANIGFNVTTLNGASEDILAVSGMTNSTTPVTSQAYANTLNVTQNSDIDVSGSLNASIGALTIGTSTLKVTSADTTTSPYSLTTGQVNFVATGAVIDVENSSGGGAGTLILGPINDGGAAQNFFKTGPGTLALNSAAVAISAPSVYTVYAGTLAVNNANALSYTFNNGSGTTTNNVGIAINTGATFSLGASQTIEGLADYSGSSINGSHVLLNGNTLTVGARDQGGTYSGVISDGTGTAGSGGLIKEGAGTEILQGASTYSGPTFIGFGTLTVANTTGSATGTGAVTLANSSGATLASATVGTISGSLTVGAQANVQPGGNGSIGTLTIGGLTTISVADLNFDLGSPSANNGDLLSVTGSNFNIAGGTLITFNSAPASPSGNGDYRLIGVTSGANAGASLTNFTLPAAPSGTGYTLSTTVDPGYIDLVVGTVAAGGVSLVWSPGTGGATGDGISWGNGPSMGSPDTQQNFVIAGTSTPSDFTSTDSVTFNDSNNGHYTVNVVSNVLPASVTVNSAGIYTIESTGGYAIGDNSNGSSTTLTQSGGGTLNILNVNTFTGATNVSGSGTTLHLASTGALASLSLSVGAGSVANIDGLLTATPSISDSGVIRLGPSDNVNFTNNPGNSYLVRSFSGVTIASGGSLVIKPATTTATRTVVVSTFLSNSGVIDIANNDMIIHNGNDGSVTTAGSIGNQIASGFDKGKWDGALGILSSNASNSALYAVGYGPGGATFDGLGTSSTDVLVKFTYYGDATLDGKVDGSDYSRIDSGFVTHATGWSNGDFNYDGVINGSDYTLIDNAFNTQGAHLSAEVAPTATIAAEIAGGGSSSSVPEPTTLSLLAIGAAGLLGRRGGSRRSR